MSQNQDSSKKPLRDVASVEFNMRMFAIGAFTFMLAQVIGLLTGYLNLSLPEFAETASIPFSVGGFLVAFLVATTVLILLIKFVKGSMLFKVMLALLMFIGSEMVLSTMFGEFSLLTSINFFGILLSDIFGISLAIIFVVMRFLKPTIILQNIVMTIAIAGIGATLGLMFPVGAIILILLILSVSRLLLVLHKSLFLLLYCIL